jgi:hypothetical protein
MIIVREAEKYTKALKDLKPGETFEVRTQPDIVYMKLKEEEISANVKVLDFFNSKIVELPEETPVRRVDAVLTISASPY